MTMIDPTTGLPVTPPAQPPAPAQPQPLVVAVPPAPPPPPPQGATMDQINEMLERVRKEEKDKLYPEIERLKGTVAQFEQEKKEREEAAAAEQARLEEEERRRAEDEMSAKELLAQQNATWESRFAELQAERDREAALRQKEAELFQLEQYKQRRISEESANIGPRFLDFIAGNNQEEIERSIATMKQKTEELMADVQAAQQGQRRQLGLPPTSGPPVDPSMMTGQQGTQSFTPEDIKNMDMTQYRQLRGQLLGAVSDRVQNQGLYAP